MDEVRQLDIAIIGMSCRLPGAKNINEYWNNLCNGIESITFFSIDELITAGIDRDLVTNPNYVPASGYIPDVEFFDAEFFSFSPREAEILDPQFRLFFECAWEALEDSGYNPDNYKGLIGVFAGAGMSLYAGIDMNHYFLCNLFTNRQYLDTLDHPQTIIANAKDYLPTRLSYKLNLRGPSVNIQTACSTSLVAVHSACQSLLNGECDIALAGAAAIHMPIKSGYLYKEGSLFSPDGHCRAFDSKAKGIVGGNGAGIVILKRLENAILDGDHIYAVIKGSAINNDGNSKVSYMAPSISGQSTVITSAQIVAEVDPETITYVETHGTGTPLGDPIEIAALTQAFRTKTQKNSFCAIGSAKTNIGHLDTAAGIASLIKTALSINHKKIPPSLNFENSNPDIDFSNSPFYVNRDLQNWNVSGIPLRAGVSSFGAGGTNAHVILEESPILYSELSKTKDQLHIFTLSAKSENALLDLVKKYGVYLKNNTHLSIRDICYTTNIGRKHFEENRFAIVVDSTNDLIISLDSFISKKTSEILKNNLSAKSDNNKNEGLVFIFTGQGSQYPEMGKELFEQQPHFRECLKKCDKILKEYLPVSILEIMFSSGDQNSLIHNTLYTQPALFSFEYSLAQFWISLGIKPAAVIGHSLGEYTAACIAGIFSLEEGLRFVAKRAQLISNLPNNGLMAVIFANIEQVNKLMNDVDGLIEIAVINGVENITVSGEKHAIMQLLNNCDVIKINYQLLKVSHAFHSQLMDPILKEFHNIAKAINFNNPTINLISNLSGQIAGNEIINPQYWARHLRETVQITKSMQTLAENGYKTFLEIGPKPIFSSIIQDNISNNLLITLYCTNEKKASLPLIYNCLKTFYDKGLNINWPLISQNHDCKRVPLPTYPFQRKKYWVDKPYCKSTYQLDQIIKESVITSSLNNSNYEKLFDALITHPTFTDKEKQCLPNLINALMDIHQQNSNLLRKDDYNNIYRIQWQVNNNQQSIYDQNTLANSYYIVFNDKGGIGYKVAQFLKSKDVDVILISPGQTIKEISPAHWEINFELPNEYKALLRNIFNSTLKHCLGIIYLWNLDCSLNHDNQIINAETLIEQLQFGVGSLLNIVQTVTHELTNKCIDIRIVTRGAMCITENDLDIQPQQAPIWGLSRTISLENQNINCICVDLDTYLSNESLKSFFKELLSPINQKQIAFRGKQIYTANVIREPLSGIAALKLNPDSSYMVTGAYGEIGLKLLNYLASIGAKHIVLLGRRDPNQSTQEYISQLKAMNINIVIEKCDVGDYQALSQIFQEIKDYLPPLKGVIHAAGIIDDGILLSQTWQKFEKVMISKVKGSWNLHLLTRDIDLDFFIMFSSVASLLGSPAQANYAAANMFMDGLAYYRMQSGLKTLSINWGPWAEIGMAAKLRKSGIQSYNKHIFEPLVASSALNILGSLISQSYSNQVCVLDLNNEILNKYNILTQPKELTEFAQLIWLTEDDILSNTHQTNKQHNLLGAQNNIDFIFNYIQNLVLNILGLPDSQDLDFNLGFQQLGIDSLMGLQLRHKLATYFNIKLPSTIIYKYPTISDVANEIFRLLNESNILQQSNITKNYKPKEITDIDDLSESEIAKRLANELTHT